MSKIFLVILYIYAALHFFAFGGRTAEVTYDSNGNVIQQVYDRKGNMIGVYDEKGIQLKEIERNSDGYVVGETTYENGRVIKEVEYEPYTNPADTNYEPKNITICEYVYTPNSTEVQVVYTEVVGDLNATHSVIHYMQSADNYVQKGASSFDSGKLSGSMEVRIHSVQEFGEDYEIRTTYNEDGTVEKVKDSREKDKEEN